MEGPSGVSTGFYLEMGAVAAAAASCSSNYHNSISDDKKTNETAYKK